MQIIGKNNKTYLLLSGIEISRKITLTDAVTFMFADTSHLDFHTAISTCRNPEDIAVVSAFIPRIASQFEIVASNAEELAIIAWNSTWDALLLSAIFNTEIGFHLQSDTEASKIDENSILYATNYHFNGMSNDKYILSDPDIQWVEQNFNNARCLLDDEAFMLAVRCLSSYRWHSLPRIQLAVLWTGIEGLFKISSEIRFRVSLYIARFLYHNNKEKQLATFNHIKRIYNIRSKAVHGSRLKEKDNDKEVVIESANILCDLIRKCIVNKSLPNEQDLVP